MLRVFADQFLRPDPTLGVAPSPQNIEVALFVRFLHTTTLSCQSNPQDFQEAYQLLQSDPRVRAMMEMLAERFGGMTQELRISCIYSLGFFFSKCGFELPNPEDYSRIIKALSEDMELPEGATHLYPGLIFVLTYFVRDGRTMEQVRALVEKFSATFLHKHSDSLDIVSCSQLSVGWIQTRYLNK